MVNKYKLFFDLIDSVKTPKFFVMSRSTDWYEFARIESRVGLFPDDYKLFLAQCGGGRFVRQWDRDVYEVRIFDTPHEASFDKGVWLIAEDGDGGMLGYRMNPRPELLEFRGLNERRANCSVGELFKKCIDRKIATYGRQRLEEIMVGPKAFLPAERIVVEALKHIEVEIVESNGTLALQISNRSHLRLRWITLGIVYIRLRSGGVPRPHGTVQKVPLDISDVGPGEIVVRPYKLWNVPRRDSPDQFPEDLVLFREYPGPEDRRYFVELSQEEVQWATGRAADDHA